MTALSGATEGAESSTAKLVNSLSSAAASGATTTFALQGVGDFLESSGGKLGKFGGALSKASGFVGAAVAGIQIAGDAFDHFSGVSDFASEGMVRVAQSAKDAAFRLDELDPKGRRSVEKESAFQLENIKRNKGAEIGGTVDLLGLSLPIPTVAGLMDSIGTFFTQGANIGSNLDFEGFDMFGAGKLEETLSAAITTAIAGGADVGQVQTQLSRISKDRDVSKEEVDQTLGFL